ncbi:hypothetical protein B5X24_HaOG212253 [Helicoverpa armigera]|uniref:Uncharacterized protein n=1 Tax=Helicoverpa armigera TaxID=29058 RepID=A0A2W1BGL3_HELAM|nr:hypothetical protein B5X24_HaOG212253 [Helicoverpa armigera]
MIVNYLGTVSGAETITWNFSERSHGKGALAGVGGSLKRTCNKTVANGRNIIDLDTFTDCSKVNCKGIMVISIDDSHVPEIQNIPFKPSVHIYGHIGPYYGAPVWADSLRSAQS